MQLNNLTVKKLRSEKGWTQQHLADACGLSLRTIQRVESEGQASKETMMSLCAVFEIRQRVLINLEGMEVKPNFTEKPISKHILVLTAVVSAVFGATLSAIFIYLIIGG
ncbi:helix-turn-helix transcriptional regulator [Pseudoalteromonas sp. T1lg65]|uniref:helix-turn-helix transcriptional regulator n=1 Tax=Pseudoalteromonas sp. T1lg65 TaxID=2077101 RepID=UPI003F7AAFD4